MGAWRGGGAPAGRPWAPALSAALLIVALLCVIRVVAAENGISGVPPYDLTDGTFDAFLSDFVGGDDWVLMEFWAHWCPHCKKFKHSYEVIGSFFNTDPRPTPHVTVARVDCADWPKVCESFQVKWFPTLRLGRPEDFVARKLDRIAELSHNHKQDVEVSIINDVAATVGAAYDTSGVFQHVVLLTPGATATLGPVQTMVDLRDTALATFEQMQQNRELMRGEEARKALVDFLPFLIKYHPIDKCRESFVELRALLADVWPEGAPEPTDFGAFERWRPCGDLVTWDTWGACRGSASDLRGFSCGFWQLLHGMTMGIGDDDAQPFVRAVGDFMMHLFGCHNCGEHFQKAALSPKSGALVQTGKDLVLWMWRIHNIVNNFTAPWSDPAFPKQQWPGPGLCWQCSKNGGRPDKDGRVQWIDDQVHLFLVDFYGYVLEGGQVRHISGSEGKQRSEPQGRARGPLGGEEVSLGTRRYVVWGSVALTLSAFVAWRGYQAGSASLGRKWERKRTLLPTVERPPPSPKSV